MHGAEVRECALRLSGVVRGVLTAGTTKLPSRRLVVCHIRKGAPKSVTMSPGRTRKRTALWIVTAGGR